MAETRQEKFKELYERGLALIGEGKDADGIKLMMEAATTAPEGWLALATELIREDQHDLALDRLREVIAISKDSRIRAAAWNNIGMILAHKGQLPAALDCFYRAKDSWPAFPDSYSNIGLCNKWRGNYKEAIRWLDRALKIDPWHEQAQFVRSMTLLLDCDYTRGFAEYECRWRSTQNGLRKVVSPTPEWNGQNGKCVFIYGEQGHGDTLLMLRYARMIRALGVRQCWIAQKSMAPLVRTIPEIDVVIENGDTLPDFDCHLPAVSLPKVLHTTINTIPPSPYIAKPPPIDLGPGFHVGICWRGSKAQKNDIIRSTRLSDWLPVLNVPGVTFHSLQVDNHEEGLLYAQIEHHHDTPKNWLDSAALVASLDLVISVDTSIVHLCGSMGVPVWCALHCRPYFVFPPSFHAQTPWYESVKLYRQEKEFEWQPVFEQIATDLCALKNS